MRILIVRLDNIGDIILTFPIAGWLKTEFPNCYITFLARHYVSDLITACCDVDAFCVWDESLTDQQQLTIIQDSRADVVLHVSVNKRAAKLCYQAQIPKRVGIINRLYNWHYCNRWVYLQRSRHRGHEAQMNMCLLKGVQHGCHQYEHSQLADLIRIKEQTSLPLAISQKMIQPNKKIIVHVGSNGNCKHWTLARYSQLIQTLLERSYQVFLTGTQAEGENYEAILLEHCPQAISVMGQLKLAELITFIASCDLLIAASTGPLHIAAALGIHCIGLFPSDQNLGPRRWAALGATAHNICPSEACPGCLTQADCLCMQRLLLTQVMRQVHQIFKDHVAPYQLLVQ